MITLKDMINGQKQAEVKTFNKDLFKADSENLTDTFSKTDYDFLDVITTDRTDAGLKETILAIKDGDAYLISTVPSRFNGEVSVAIYSKWLTLQGFNWIIKKELEKPTSKYIDEEGYLTNTVIDYYNLQLAEALGEDTDVTYSDILDLGEYNSEYNCVTLSATIETKRYSLTINERKQLSKITIRDLDKSVTASPQEQKVYKSILD